MAKRLCKTLGKRRCIKKERPKLPISKRPRPPLHGLYHDELASTAHNTRQAGLIAEVYAICGLNFGEFSFLIQRLDPGIQIVT